MQKADQVAVHVRVWVLDRVADAGLGRQVDHVLEHVGLEHGLHSDFVSQVELDELEAGAVAKLGDPGLLE